MGNQTLTSKSWGLLVGVAAMLALTSCAGRTGAEPPVPQASVTSQAPSSSSAAPVEFTTELCTTLLDPATVAAFTERGFVVSDEKFIESARADAVGHEDTYPARFLDSGGTVCRWGAEGGDQSVIFAYGALAEGQGDKERAQITVQGAKPVDSSDYERYTEPYGYEGGYAFGDGYWAYVLDNGAKDILDEIVRNAPAF